MENEIRAHGNFPGYKKMCSQKRIINCERVVCKA